MSYKILTKNGIDNTNIDGARGEYFNSGMRDGIVQGALNEGLFTATASNIISLDTCELRIAGHRIVIDEPVYHTFTNAPSTNTRYAFIAQIVVDANQNVDFSLFVQTASTPLIQNDLYKTITGAGTYQIEIGRFTLLTTLTIEDVVRTIDVITGGTGKGSGASINIGNVTTQTLDSDVNAEVDVSERYEEDEGKEYLDFQFGIPKGDKGDKGEQGIQGIQGDKGDKGDTGATGDEALTTSYVFSETSDPNPQIIMIIHDDDDFNRTPKNDEDLIVLWNNTTTGDTFICNCKTIIGSSDVGTNIKILDYYKLNSSGGGIDLENSSFTSPTQGLDMWSPNNDSSMVGLGSYDENAGKIESILVGGGMFIAQFIDMTTGAVGQFDISKDGTVNIIAGNGVDIEAGFSITISGSRKKLQMYFGDHGIEINSNGVTIDGSAPLTEDALANVGTVKSVNNKTPDTTTGNVELTSTDLGLGENLLNWRDDFSNMQAYKKNDVVLSNQLLYVCKEGYIGFASPEPANDTTHWKPLTFVKQSDITDIENQIGDISTILSSVVTVSEV